MCTSSSASGYGNGCRIMPLIAMKAKVGASAASAMTMFGAALKPALRIVARTPSPRSWKIVMVVPHVTRSDTPPPRLLGDALVCFRAQSFERLLVDHPTVEHVDLAVRV